MVLSFLNPLMHNLSFAVQMLIGNVSLGRIAYLAGHASG